MVFRRVPDVINWRRYSQLEVDPRFQRHQLQIGKFPHKAFSYYTGNNLSSLLTIIYSWWLRLCYCSVSRQWMLHSLSCCPDSLHPLLITVQPLFLAAQPLLHAVLSSLSFMLSSLSFMLCCPASPSCCPASPSCCAVQPLLHTVQPLLHTVQPLLHAVLSSLSFILSSSADPWHFGVDPDPDPWIHASDQWIRIRGSMSLTNGSGSGFRSRSGSCYFRNFLTHFFLLITFWSYIYIIFQR